MHSWSSEAKTELQTRVDSLYLLTENNQWRPTKDLYFYTESTGGNNNMNDAIPCLKLDYRNRNQQHLNKFLDFFNIQKIRQNDLKLADDRSSPAEYFRQKLIEISPFLKKWLKHSSVSSEAISSIDKKIQQENDFIESDRLQLYYNQNFVQEANVYYDIHHKQLYVRRPWNSETTFMNLPYKLCQLLDIRGFEQNIRLLLKGTIEEIKNHFYANSIEIPTKDDIVILESLPKTGASQQPKPPLVPAAESKASTTPRTENKKSALSVPVVESSKPVPPVENKEIGSNKQENVTKPAEPLRNNPRNTPYNVGPVLHLQQPFPNNPYPDQFPPNGMIPVPMQVIHPPIQNFERTTAPHFIQLAGAEQNTMELIDIASITTSNSVLYESPFDGTSGNESSNLRTGFIGESMVYAYLLNKYHNQLNSVSIVWNNQAGESGLPYDFLVTINGETQYIEVKSTQTYNQHMFPVSMKEIEFLSRHKKNYFIYRVFTEENQFIILDNIPWRSTQKGLAFFLRILPRPAN